jgi:aryl-alcohol dehydrogenase-like predicted oxidoreductase
MDYAALGRTGLKVSRLCLGTAFRSERDKPACVEVIRRAVDLGCNFIDCANAYREGLSEEIVGEAVRGDRDSLVIASKVGAAVEAGINGGGLSRKAIMREAEASLRRLRTGYIDLYLCHFPDPGTPLEETLRAMDDLVRQGKIRYTGCCNFPAWQLCESLWISDRANLASFVCDQVAYNLLDRRAEEELLTFCRHKNVSVTAFAPTAIGLLSGQCRRGQPPPPGSPWDRGPYNYRAAMTAQTDRVIQELLDIARERGKTPMQVALAWCLTRPEVTSVIIGADTVEHVDEDFGAARWKLSDEERARLDRLTEGMRMSIRKDAPDGYRPGEPWS